MCAGTAGAAMLIVCSPPLAVLWQTSIFSRPLPKSPPPASAQVDVVWLVVLVERVVDVVLEVVCPLSSESFSPDSDSDSWSSADCPSRPPVVVVCVEVVWDSVVLVAGWLSVEPVVTCARPTPAAAANASPTSAPTTERRVMRVSLLRTWNPFGAWRAGAYVWSVAIDGRNLRRAPSDGGLRCGRVPAAWVRRAERVGFPSP